MLEFRFDTQLCGNYVQLFCKVDIISRLSTYDLVVSKTCCCTDCLVVFFLLRHNDYVSALKCFCNLWKKFRILLHILAAFNY